jgi:hypothetical protein
MSTNLQKNLRMLAPELAPPHVPLSTFIEIGAGFTRSVNLERDRDTLELLRTYVPTSRAIAALEQLAEGLDGEPSARALALIGPFGAGKSAFALFAGALLGPPGRARSAGCVGNLTQHRPQAWGPVC